MYDYIKGILAHKSSHKEAIVTIDVNGIGYLALVTNRDYSSLPAINSEMKIYTILLHREDSMSLCGFSQREDRDIFKILTSVSGVGAKMALMLLDEFESFELISLVIKGDFKELTRAKGVGPKLAQKIILELKDKLVNLQNSAPISLSENIQVKDEQALQDAQSVLVSLGYEREEIKKAMTKAIPFVKDQANAEEVLKETLRLLSM